MTYSKNIDAIDFKILEILEQNARISNLDLSKAINLSPSSTLKRTRQLETSGIIQGYFTRINPTAHINSIRALIHVTLSSPQYWNSSTKSKLLEIQQVTDIYEVIGGDTHYILTVSTNDNQSLQNILQYQISTLNEVGSTSTNIITTHTHKLSLQPIPL